MPYEWIVSHQDLSMHCKCCGASYKPNSPVPVNLYVAMTDAFVEDHKGCSLSDRTPQKYYAKLYEIPLGACIQIDNKPVRCESRYRDGDKVFFNGEQIFGDPEAEVPYTYISN
jgi:hypothetical protein